MNLSPVFNNNSGVAYTIKNTLNGCNDILKVQIQFADIGLILTKEEVKKLLKVALCSKKSCQCKDCIENKDIKILKCSTDFGTVILKVKREKLKDFSELLQGALFGLEMETLLIS